MEGEAGTPLLGRASSKSSIWRYTAAVSAVLACGLIALLVQAKLSNRVSLAQSVKYYYVPKSAVNNKKLPLHLMIPRGDGQGSEEYTLVAAPFVSLDGNATAAPAAGAKPNVSAAADTFSCSLDKLKALAPKVYENWEKCATSSDYKVPNADAKRRLLSVGQSYARTQNLKWVWVPGQGEPLNPPLHSMMLEDNKTAAPAANATGNASAAKPTNKLSDCMEKAAKDTCTKMVGCKDPVCAHYYNDPDIERLCGICTMSAAGGLGCFASDVEVVVEGRGSVPVGSVAVGEKILGGDGDGSMAFSRVYFIHDHLVAVPTVRLEHDNGVLELTAAHMLPIYTPACGDSYCEAAPVVPAKTVSAGDRVYVREGARLVAREVRRVGAGFGKVRYLLTESGTLVAGGALASVLSTGAGPLETLPFRALDVAWRGVLQAPAMAAALAAVLESPALRAAETLVNRFAVIQTKVPSSTSMWAASVAASA